MTQERNFSAGERLASWKEIAAYLHHGVRTVQRWERNGLPVYRHPVLGTVHAFKSELDAWMNVHVDVKKEDINDKQDARFEAGEEKQKQLPKPLTPSVESRSSDRGFRWRAAFLGTVVVALILLLANRVSNPQPMPQGFYPGRIFARSLSEGRSPQIITLDHSVGCLATAKNGKQLYASCSDAHLLSVINVVDGKVETLVLPESPHAMAIARDGKLYLGSQVEGLRVFDTKTGQLLPAVIQTGGPVFDIAVTPDGDKLFLAMSQAGVKVLHTRSGRLRQVTNRTCPENIELDAQGKNLYVSYQCSGPVGRPGHDALEVIDASNGAIRGIIQGPPMVGGDLSVSPDGSLVAVDGKDACTAPNYDHLGCPSVPSGLIHLIRPLDRVVLKTLAPPETSHPRFLSNSQLASSTSSLAVFDTRTYATLERWDPGFRRTYPTLRSPDGRWLYVAGGDKLLALEIEGAECAPPAAGLKLFFSGDGTWDDSATTAVLERNGNVEFRPGRVGQAFAFDGGGYVNIPSTGHFHAFGPDSTFIAYVKFATEAGEMTIMDWTIEGGANGDRVVKSSEDRLLFQTGASLSTTLASTTRIKTDTWYHVAITKTNSDAALYVNGLLAEKRARPPQHLNDESHPRFGSNAEGNAPLHGKLDEITFYNRALTEEEIKSLYQRRESGPCKL
jgi:DNA-binding beta-propeller fold protein YncE